MIELKDISDEGGAQKKYAIEDSGRPPRYLATINIQEGAIYPIMIEVYGTRVKVSDHRDLMVKARMSDEFWIGVGVGVLCFSILAVLVQSLGLWRIL